MYRTYDVTYVFYTYWCCLLLISPLESLCFCAGEPMPARPSTSMMWGRQRGCRLKAAMNSWMDWKCLEILWISLQFLESRKIPVTKNCKRSKTLCLFPCNCRSAVLQVTDASNQRSSRLERCSDKGKPTHCFEAQRIPKRKWMNYGESTIINTRTPNEWSVSSSSKFAGEDLPSFEVGAARSGTDRFFQLLPQARQEFLKQTACI
jgi:hypothetical protein